MGAVKDDHQINNGMPLHALRQPESERTRSSSSSQDGCSHGDWTVVVCPDERLVTREVTNGTRCRRPEL
jgi:hypothetical protein